MRKKQITRLQQFIIIVLMVLSVSSGIYALFLRTTGLPQIAEYLPEDTQAFVLLNLYKSSLVVPDTSSFDLEILGQPLDEQDWIGQYGGMAFIEDELVYVLTHRSKKKTESFFDSLGEAPLIENSPDVFCHETQSFCYRIEGRMLFWTHSDSVLSQISPENTYEETPFYQNVANRLPRLSDGMFAISSEFALTQITRNSPSNPLGLLSSSNWMEELFPGAAGVFHIQDDQIIIDHFLAVDKEVLDGEGLYRPQDRFHADLLKFTPQESMLLEWSGQDLNAQVTRLLEVLEQLSITNHFVTQLALSPWINSTPLFENEFYFGLKDRGQWLLLLEVPQNLTFSGKTDSSVSSADSPASTSEIASYHPLENLLNQLTNNMIATDGSSLTQVLAEHDNIPYQRFSQGELFVLAAAEIPATKSLTSSDPTNLESENFSTLLFGNWEEGFFDSLTALTNQDPLRDLSKHELNIAVADQWTRFTLDTWTPIIDHPLSDQLEELVSTKKLFDDGMMTRSILSFQ
jgi:hypothetical protein